MSALPDTGTLGLADRPRIVNHDCAAQGSPSGSHLDASRALGLTEPGDIIQLPPELQEDWPAILAHYRRIGLSHTEDVIWDLSPEALAAYPGFRASVFLYGSRVARNRPNPRWQAVVDRTDDRNRFLDLAETLGMTVPRTLRFADTAAVDDVERLPYPCYVKAAITAPGAGSTRCETPDQVVAALHRIGPRLPLQIQAAVDSELFLTLQYRVQDGTAVPLAATEQLCDGGLYRGYRYPARHAPWPAVDPMAQWMARSGMRGMFAFDVGVVEGPTGPQFLPVACHPRFTDPSYPAIVAAQLGLDAWLAVRLDTSCRHLAEIFLHDLEYDPASGRGVVIVNWGSIKAGRLGVLIAGTPEDQQTLQRLLAARLRC